MTRHFAPFKCTNRALLAILFFLFAAQASAQTMVGRQKVDAFVEDPWHTTYALTWLPTDYHTNTTQKYPLLIFLHGVGETGTGPTGVNKLLWTGLPQIIANGWNPEAVNPVDGQNYKFIVISPQAQFWTIGWDKLSKILPDMMTRYRVDPSRVYVTGVSAGGNGAWTCVNSGPEAAQKFAAIVPVASAAGIMDSIPNVGARDGVKMWTICGDLDQFYGVDQQMVNVYNAANPHPKAVLTTLPGQGHWSSAWNLAYSADWRNNQHNLNVFEWMLQYKRPTTGALPLPLPLPAPLPNTPPTTNAGADQTITLPTSSVTLTGTAADPGGSIASYAWTKVSGPASALFSSPNAAATTVTALVQGTYVFRLTATDNAGATATDDVQVTVNPAPAPPPAPAPGTNKIEAEAWTVVSGVNTEPTSDAGGGSNVGWRDTNDWMDYSVNVTTTGTYTVNFRVAAVNAGAQFQLRKGDGTVLTTVNVPVTNGFQTYETVAAQVTLVAGQQNLRIVTTNGGLGWNINWWEIAGMATAPAPAPAPVPVPTTSIKIEAENWSAMAGVGTENAGDAGGGLNVGWQDANDWMDYSVNVATAGTYTVNFRVAALHAGAQFQLIKSDGTVLLTKDIPVTGGTQIYWTISAQVTLPAGQQTLRIVTTNGGLGWNINWWEIAGATSSGTIPVPVPTSSIKIEAENWSNMEGVSTEPTGDAGGGLNVGWQDTNDWMDYSVNISTAGTYKVNFRVAAMFAGAQFQLRNAAGAVLATINVPVTGGTQAYSTVSANVAFNAGRQTFRIVTTNGGVGWNINWWEIILSAPTSGTVSSSGVASAAAFGTAAAASALEIYPNPVQDRFVLNVNTTATGTMKVQVVDMSGATVKQFLLNKSTEGASQSYLSIGDLKTGQYILKVTIGTWSQTAKLIKE